MSEEIRESAAEVFEGNHLFAVARLEGSLSVGDLDGVRRGRGEVVLSQYDRTRDPRGLFLTLKSADRGQIHLEFLTWERRKSSGQVSLMVLPSAS